MIKEWLRKRLVPGAPSSFLDTSYIKYADLLSKTLNEKEKRDNTIRIVVIHILENDYVADPVSLMFKFVEEYPEMSIEELLMLMFKVGISIKDYVDDKRVFLQTVKSVKDLPEQFNEMINEMEMQIESEEAAKEAAKSMDLTRFEPQRQEAIEPPKETKEINIQSKLKGMSSGELNELLNELITVMEKKEEQIKRIKETNKRSREQNGSTES